MLQNKIKMCFCLGFPKTQSVSLVNQSKVPVTFALRVCGDGTIPPILCTEFAEASVKPSLPSHCREFTIFPNCGVIQANSSSPIEVKSIVLALMAFCDIYHQHHKMLFYLQ